MDGHIVAAALEFFGMGSVESEPTKNKFSSTMGTSDRVKYINKTVGKFVDKFVLNFEAEASSILATEENDEENEENDEENCETAEHEPDDGVFNYVCRLLSCGLLFRDFQYATKEGDGKRICRLWKFFVTLQDQWTNQVCTGSIQPNGTDKCSTNAKDGTPINVESNV